jgi:hypothetical protein
MNVPTMFFGGVARVLEAIEDLRRHGDERLDDIIVCLVPLAHEVERIGKVVDEILADLTEFPEAESISFLVSLDGGPAFDVETGGNLQAKVSSVISVHLVARDKFGNETSLEEGSVSWVPTGDLVITASGDGMSAKIGATGPASSGNLAQVTGDADLGEGERKITGTLQVDWLPGDAVSVDIQVDSVEAVP